MAKTSEKYSRAIIGEDVLSNVSIKEINLIIRNGKATLTLEFEDRPKLIISVEE